MSSRARCALDVPHEINITVSMRLDTAEDQMHSRRLWKAGYGSARLSSQHLRRQREDVKAGPGKMMRLHQRKKEREEERMRKGERRKKRKILCEDILS